MQWKFVAFSVTKKNKINNNSKIKKEMHKYSTNTVKNLMWKFRVMFFPLQMLFTLCTNEKQGKKYTKKKENLMKIDIRLCVQPPPFPLREQAQPALYIIKIHIALEFGNIQIAKNKCREMCVRVCVAVVAPHAPLRCAARLYFSLA